MAAKFVVGVDGPMLQSFWRRLLGDGDLSELKAAEFAVFEVFALQSCQGESARENVFFVGLLGVALICARGRFAQLLR